MITMSPTVMLSLPFVLLFLIWSRRVGIRGTCAVCEPAMKLFSIMLSSSLKCACVLSSMIRLHKEAFVFLSVSRTKLKVYQHQCWRGVLSGPALIWEFEILIFNLSLHLASYMTLGQLYSHDSIWLLIGHASSFTEICSSSFVKWETVIKIPSSGTLLVKWVYFRFTVLCHLGYHHMEIVYSLHL